MTTDGDPEQHARLHSEAARERSAILRLPKDSPGFGA